MDIGSFSCSIAHITLSYLQRRKRSGQAVIGPVMMKMGESFSDKWIKNNICK